MDADLVRALECPIGLCAMKNPCVLSCGHTFSKDNITRCFEASGVRKCPVCSEYVGLNMPKNFAIEAIIDIVGAWSSLNAEQARQAQKKRKMEEEIDSTIKRIKM